MEQGVLLGNFHDKSENNDILHIPPKLLYTFLRKTVEKWAFIF